MHVMITE